MKASLILKKASNLAAGQVSYSLLRRPKMLHYLRMSLFPFETVDIFRLMQEVQESLRSVQCLSLIRFLWANIKVITITEW